MFSLMNTTSTCFFNLIHFYAYLFIYPMRELTYEFLGIAFFVGIHTLRKWMEKVKMIGMIEVWKFFSLLASSMFHSVLYLLVLMSSCATRFIPSHVFVTFQLLTSESCNSNSGGYTMVSNSSWRCN